MQLSAECLGWTQAANCSVVIDDATETLVLSSQAGAGTRYLIRARGRDRLELRESFLHESSRPVLFAAHQGVLERHLVSILGDELRDDLGHPHLELPCTPEDLAEHFTADNFANGYRVLSLDGVGPVAAAPDPHLSLVTLVPLSHYLGWTVADLKRSFLNIEGKPLLRGHAYTPTSPPSWLLT